MRALFTLALLSSATVQAAERPSTSTFGPTPPPQEARLLQDSEPAAPMSGQSLQDAFGRGQRLSRIGEGLIYTGYGGTIVVIAVATTQATVALFNDPDFDPEDPNTDDIVIDPWVTTTSTILSGVSLVGTGLLLAGNHRSRTALQAAGSPYPSTLGWAALGLSTVGWALWPVGLLANNTGVSSLSGFITLGGVVCAVIDRYQVRNKGRALRLAGLQLPGRRGDLLAVDVGPSSVGLRW